MSSCPSINPSLEQRDDVCSYPDHKNDEQRSSQPPNYDPAIQLQWSLTFNSRGQWSPALVSTQPSDDPYAVAVYTETCEQMASLSRPPAHSSNVGERLPYINMFFNRDMFKLMAMSGIAWWKPWFLAPIATYFVVIKFHSMVAMPKAPASSLAKFLDGNLVGGHRGCSADAPENTIAAFELAASHGAHAIEFDLEFTKDNHPVLMHDDTLDRTTNVTGRISDWTWDRLKEVNAAAKFIGKSFPHTAVPTLEEAILFCMENNLKIFFDVKAPDQRAVAALKSMYQKYPWLYENGIVCSFYPWLVYLIKQADPNILTGHTWRRWAVTYSDCENTKPRFNGLWHYLAVFWDIVNVHALHSWLPGMSGADLILTHRAEISQEYVLNWQKRGLAVAVWTVNDMREQLYYRDCLQIPYLTDRTSTTPLLDNAAKMLQVEHEPLILKVDNDTRRQLP